MEPDFMLTDVSGRTILLDTKYKILSSGNKPSREDLYQMYAYATAGEAPYDEIVLLYPSTDFTPPRPPFQHSKVRLFARSFDPRIVYDSANGQIDRDGVVKQFNAAFSDIYARETTSL